MNIISLSIDVGYDLVMIENFKPPYEKFENPVEEELFNVIKVEVPDITPEELKHYLLLLGEVHAIYNDESNLVQYDKLSRAAKEKIEEFEQEDKIDTDKTRKLRILSIIQLFYSHKRSEAVDDLRDE